MRFTEVKLLRLLLANARIVQTWTETGFVNDEYVPDYYQAYRIIAGNGCEMRVIIPATVADTLREMEDHSILESKNFHSFIPVSSKQQEAALTKSP